MEIVFYRQSIPLAWKALGGQGEDFRFRGRWVRVGWMRMGEIQGRISVGQAGVHCEKEEEEEEVRGFLRSEAIFC